MIDPEVQDRLEAVDGRLDDLTAQVRAVIATVSNMIDAERDRVDGLGRRVRQLESPAGERESAQ